MSKRAGSVRRLGSAGTTRADELAEASALESESQDVEAAGDLGLRGDQPRWARDRFTVSAATKALIDRIKPLALRVFGFWDHRVHRLALDEATIGVDSCGSYRCE